MTEVRRIDISTVDDLDEAIKSICVNMAAGGYRLASSFAYQTQLILIFQTDLH